MIDFPIVKVLDSRTYQLWLARHSLSDGRTRIPCEALYRSLFQCARLFPCLSPSGLTGRLHAADGCGLRGDSAAPGTLCAVAARDCQRRAHRRPCTRVGSPAQTSPYATAAASSQPEPYPQTDVMNGTTFEVDELSKTRGQKACSPQRFLPVPACTNSPCTSRSQGVEPWSILKASRPS
jgi:hypothetical protein